MSPMDPLRKAMGAVDGFQRRHRWVGVPYAVQKKFGDDNANLVVVALAWYGFLAIFPLLLVVVTIFNLIGAGSLGTTLVHTLQEFPVIGSDFPKASSDQSLNGSTVGLIVGLLGLVYGVQGVTQTAHWRWRRCGISRKTSAPASCRGSVAAWPGSLPSAARSSSTRSSPPTPPAAPSNYAIRIPVIFGLLVINIVLYFATFTLLTAKVIGPRGLIPGAVLGGIVFTALITVGTGLITHQSPSTRRRPTVRSALVIGIVTFLLLLAKLSLYAAELNPVLSRNLHPRALPLGGEPTEAELSGSSPISCIRRSAATTRRSASGSATTPPKTRPPTRRDGSNPTRLGRSPPPQTSCR